MKYLLGSAIILLCLLCAKLLVYFLNTHFPAPLLAMLFLLVLLLTGLVKEHHIKPTASPILNIMPIFFIPAGVGFIEHLELIRSHWVFLVSVVIFVPMTTLLLLSNVIAFFKGKENND